MAFYPEVMPPTQQHVLRQLGPLAADRGFYLAGGTALAIQMGHRRSVDLDWFTAGEIDPMGLAADLQEAGVPFDVRDMGKGTLHGAARDVSLSFLEYRYPDVVQPVEWPEYQVRLAGLEDLACMKLSAVGGRGGKNSDFGHTVFALTYFDDAEEEATPDLLWQVNWDEVKRTIEGWVRDYVRKQGS